MASDTKNVKFGVCNVKYNDIDLGYTKGGVEVTVETNTHEVTVDQFGETPINESIMGRRITIKVPLAETTVENLIKIMPGARLEKDAVDETKTVVVVPSGVGVNLLDSAKKLVLHPKNLDADDHSEDLVVPCAATPGGMTFSYKVDDERLFDIEFKGYPDADGNLFYYGDTSALGTSGS